MANPREIAALRVRYKVKGAPEDILAPELSVSTADRLVRAQQLRGAEIYSDNPEGGITRRLGLATENSVDPTQIHARIPLVVMQGTQNDCLEVAQRNDLVADRVPHPIGHAHPGPATETSLGVALSVKRVLAGGRRPYILEVGKVPHGIPGSYHIPVGTPEELAFKPEGCAHQHPSECDHWIEEYREWVQRFDNRDIAIIGTHWGYSLSPLELWRFIEKAQEVAGTGDVLVELATNVYETNAGARPETAWLDANNTASGWRQFFGWGLRRSLMQTCGAALDSYTHPSTAATLWTNYVVVAAGPGRSVWKWAEWLWLTIAMTLWLLGVSLMMAICLASLPVIVAYVSAHSRNLYLKPRRLHGKSILILTSVRSCTDWRWTEVRSTVQTKVRISHHPIAYEANGGSFVHLVPLPLWMSFNTVRHPDDLQEVERTIRVQMRNYAAIHPTYCPSDEAVPVIARAVSRGHRPMSMTRTITYMGAATLLVATMVGVVYMGAGQRHNDLEIMPLAGVEPLKNPPYAFSSNLTNEAAGLASRVLQPLHAYQEGIWRRAMAVVPDLTNVTVTPMNWTDFLGRYDHARRVALEKAREHVDQFGMPNWWNRLTAFVKIELYNSTSLSIGKEVKSPRIIQEVTDVVKATLGPYTTAALKALKLDWTASQPVFYAGGHSPLEIGDWLRLVQEEMSGPVFLEMDFKRWDSTLNQEALNVEIEIMRQQMDLPPELVPVLQGLITTRGQTRNGIKYRVRAGRKSGTPNTTLGNCLLHGLVQRYAFRLLGLSYRGIIMGDDAVVAVQGWRDDYLGRLNATYVAFGLRAEIIVHRSTDRVSFCSQYFWPVTHLGGNPDVPLGPTYILGPKGGRQSGKFGYHIGRLREAKQRRLVKGAALSHMPQGGVVPGLRVLLSQAISQQVDPQTPRKWMGFVPEGSATKIEIDERWYRMVGRVYGMSADALDAWMIRDRDGCTRHMLLREDPE